MNAEAVLEVDELVVGAGLTGLVYANVAAAHGRRVLVVEKHTKPGGYATNFLRKNRFTFDCSLHKITGFGEDGNLEDALRRADLLRHLSFHEYPELTTFMIGGRTITLPVRGEELDAELKRQFPHESAAIDRFMGDVRTYGRQTYMLARVALGEHDLDMDLFVECRRLSRITTHEYFMGIFSDPVLTSMLCALAINLGVETYEADALYFLHFAYTFMLTTKVYVKGSSQYLSDTLADQLAKRGGQLLVGQRLLGFDVEDGAITGARTKRNLIKTGRVVFTACPHHVMELLPPEHACPEFQGKLDQLEFGLGAFMLYLGLSVPPSELGIERSDYLIADEAYLDDPELTTNTELRYERWPLSISNYHALDEGYGHVVQLGVLEQQDDWFELDREAYKAKKQRVAEQLLARASRYFPRLREAIVYMDVSTPRTNKKYTNSGGGSSFGYKPVPKRNTRFLQKPPVKGLQFVGTWVNGAGYEPAMCLGFTEATLHQQKTPQQQPQRIEEKELVA